MKVNFLERLSECLSFVLVGLVLVLSTKAAAQSLPAVELEPLPTAPEKRLYYGKYYDPARYQQCMSFTPEKRRLWGYGDCQQFALKLEPFDPKRRDEFGEKYDLRKYHDCVKRFGVAELACDVYALRRKPQPEYWPYPPVHAIKWPEAPQPPTYRRGMNPKEYFEALCKREAGELIYRTVENVKSIYVVRPRKWEGTDGYQDRYVMEDPYGFIMAESYLGRLSGMLLTQPNLRRISARDMKYDFLEYPLSPIEQALRGVLTRYVKVTADPLGNLGESLVEPRTTLESRYGFTWRGIKRPHDREMGVAGGELAVVELKTGEILGIRRGFGMTRKNRVNWEAMPVCPEYPDHAFNKDVYFTLWFLRQVLKPRSLSQFKERNK
jgi:hypothetical protein